MTDSRVQSLHASIKLLGHVQIVSTQVSLRQNQAPKDAVRKGGLPPLKIHNIQPFPEFKVPTDGERIQLERG
jgi:hypothetical protein